MPTPSRSTERTAPGLDAIDRQILRTLQADGRITNAELAKRVRLSASPCLRRVRALEEAGYITGYSAVLDPVLLERNLLVVVLVSLGSQRQEVLEAFETAVGAIDDVLSCHLIAGEADYLLTVAVRDLDAYQRLYTRRFGELPGVTSMRSMVTMKSVKASTSLPV